MPPNDDPFATVPNPNEPEPGKPAGEPAAPTPVVPDPGPSMADALAAATGPLKETIERLNAQLAQAEAARQAPAPAPVLGKDEWSQAFYENPQEMIQKEWASASSPLVKTLADQVAEQNYDAQRTRVDAKWGAGSFDKVVDSELRPIIDEAKEINAEGLLNRQMFINAVDTIVGRKAEDLVTFRTESQKTAESATLQDVEKLKATVLADVQPNLRGGIRHGGVAGTPELDEEQTQYIKQMFLADGVKRDSKRLAALQHGEIKTLEDYREFEAKMKENS